MNLASATRALEVVNSLVRITMPWSHPSCYMTSCELYIAIPFVDSRLNWDMVGVLTPNIKLPFNTQEAKATFEMTSSTSGTYGSLEVGTHKA